MTALITGAANGLGRALTDALLRQGERVIGVDRNWPEDSSHDNLIKVTADLGDIAGFEPIMDVLEAHGPFKTIIFNAAVSATGPFETIPNEAHQRLLDINATNPILMSNRLIKNNKISDNGSLIYVASLSVQIGYPGATSYATSKAILANFAKSIRKVLKDRAINVLTVYPGPMKTDQASKHAPTGATAEKRMSPEDVAEQILAANASRKKDLIPGTANKLFALFGKIAPNLIGKMMKKIIYDKLQRTTY